MVIVSIALLTVLASAVGTITGFGTSIILMPVVLFFLPLPQTLLLVGVIHWFGNIWKILFFKKGFNWKLVLIFGFSGIVASYIGATSVFSISEKTLTQILGGFLVLYVLYLFFNPAFQIPKKNSTVLIGGALSGFFAGIFGIGGAVRGAFLSVFDLSKEVYIVTAGAIALFIDSTRIVTYLLNGIHLEQSFVWGFLLFIPASFLGAAIAKKVVQRIPQNKFRALIALFLLLAGLKLLFFSAA